MAKTSKSEPSARLSHVKYEIRGPLDRRAQELERQGHEIIKMNIGNPAAFGFEAPESLRRAIIENISLCSGYGPSKGIFPAREAVVTESQTKGIKGVTLDDVFMGNGVSELILMTMEALLNPGDEVLLPSPDYPLWSASVILNHGCPVYYPCPPSHHFMPDVANLESLVTPKTRAIVIINPNNPTGAVYSKDILQGLVNLAERHQLLIFSDEIYDRILYDGAIHVPTASLCKNTLCATFGGLSKVYRASGFRTGWVFFSGNKSEAGAYLKALDLLASLRLCSNVLGQWAVQTALGGTQSIYELTSPQGRLGKQRQSLINIVKKSESLSLIAPQGALYAFVGINTDLLPKFNDQDFALKLLEEKHVLLVPGSSFNVNYKNYFRTTFLPDQTVIENVFSRIEDLFGNLFRTTKKINAAS